ncbi:lasso peptide biosynthesis B2 protein [Novosphingobium sp.]|uniref:lasso peptide biosynthesis B2 protein n=1 Tax=Novosphingobium sp. TaxID=1874826 RepID=UPI0025F87DC8|nr:lasso peptide biosynthesis B2 protein [Novosphingobium sp.]
MRKLSGKGPIVIIDCLCAVYELARANRKFHKLPAGELVDHVRLPAAGSIVPADGQLNSKIAARIVERVAFAIPAIALRVPWRADCMVQAIAAQNWLGRYNIPSTMTIGVRKDAAAGFGAHAWLAVGDVLVTGGDISGYVAIEVSGGPDA